MRQAELLDMILNRLFIARGLALVVNHSNLDRNCSVLIISIAQLYPVPMGTAFKSPKIANDTRGCEKQAA